MAERARDDKAVCFRHPTVTARRHCFHCRRPICPKCQHRIEGHIFCSKHCAKAQKRAEAWRRLVHWNEKALSGVWFRVVIFGGIVILGSLAIWLSSRADRFFSGPDIAVPVFKRVHERSIDQEKIDWNSPGAVAIQSPAPGSVLSTNTVSVSGVAPREAMVGLYVNGRKVDAQMAADGKWHFDAVPMDGRRNVIQARYFDNKGNSSYSPAVTVNLLTRPAAPLVAEKTTAPEPPVDGLNLIRAPVGNRQVLLTFDGGSDANATSMILDILEREKIHATIFLTGEYMKRYPELVRRIAEDGHTVGNHTYSHPHLTTYSFNERQQTLTGVTQAFLKSQLDRANEVFRLITGRNMSPYWRAPFGEFNRQILRWAADDGYRAVYWTPHLDTLDWVNSPSSPLYHGPKQILDKILRQADNGPSGVDGGIILMHLGSGRPEDARADVILQPLIDDLRSEGYTFTTVDKVGWPKKG